MKFSDNTEFLESDNNKILLKNLKEMLIKCLNIEKWLVRVMKYLIWYYIIVIILNRQIIIKNLLNIFKLMGIGNWISNKIIKIKLI